jgi:hypothetical protein
MMLILQNAYTKIVFLFMIICGPSSIYCDSDAETNPSSGAIKSEVFDDGSLEVNDIADKSKSRHIRLLYYLNISDFIPSFIEIPTSNVAVDSTTIASSYLAGRAPLYDRHNVKVGTCSASFLNMQNADGIFTDISNYLSVDNGLVISWLTPTTLINLELDSIVNSMVTECIVKASTKIGRNPFYGKEFNMIVSSQSGRIYFQLTELKRKKH